MTCLVSWVGVDSRGPASIYVASESRITWPPTNRRWDFARKVFASRMFPEIIGYAGEVLFTVQVLGQWIDAVESGAIFEPDVDSQTRFLGLAATVRQSFETYPSTATPFQILHCAREGQGMGCSFVVNVLSWDPSKKWYEASLRIPSRSQILAVYGSGEPSFRAEYSRWQSSEIGGTSRAVFGAFCAALRTGADASSGGAPQLVGLYRKKNSETFGIIHENRRYLLGIPVENFPALGVVEWRNELFERCDPHTTERIPGAQRHSRPKGM
jgi:hypothetical protein